MAVGGKYGNDGRLAVDAQQHGGRFVGDGGDGGHRDAVTPRAAVGGDNVHAGGA